MLVATTRSVVVLLFGSVLAGCGDDSALFSSSGGDSGTGASSSGGGSDSGGAPGKNSGGGSKAGGGAGNASGGEGGELNGGSAGSAGMGVVGCDAPASAAPAETWVNATGNLANMESECGNLGLVAAQPCSSRVVAGVAKKGLWQTVDGGQTWSALGTGAGSAAISNRISSLVFDPLDPETFWESGIYNGGGVYRSNDGGAIFEQLGDVSHCDSVSVDLTDPGRKTLIAGTHESNSPLHYSNDGGQSWSNISHGFPEGYCTSTLVLDATTFLVGCAASILRTTNAGETWQPVTGATSGGTFQPLRASDGTIYWPGNGGGVWTSSDDGLTFVASAMQNEAPGLVSPAQLAELPDGRVVIVGTDHLLSSDDQGQSWQPLGAALPYPGGGYDGVRGVTYSAQTKTFFVWRWDCADTVPENAIMAMGFDWEQ